MKKHTPEKGHADLPLVHLGGLSAREFLQRYWQKKPLLVRNAFADFAGPLSKREVLELARHEEAESRLIARSGRTWTLQSGPLARGDFNAARHALWTVLIQDTQHFSPAAHDLLARFSFIPYARIDDLMVSYAVPGAGVGPHTDSYDVFLIQGMGKRRWQISAQRDLRLKSNLPLRMLAHFKAEQEFVLDPGDMLYLPPGYAHNGVAVSESLTWSVGFRAPTRQELSTALLDYLRDEISLEGEYRDPDLMPARQPGEINAAMQKRVATLLAELQTAAQNAGHLRRCLGRHLTDPKPHVFFSAPEPAMGAAEFRHAAKRRGIVLDLKSRFLYANDLFFMNGGEFPAASADASALRLLANTRRLSRESISNAGKTLFASLYDAYASGFLHVS